MMDGNLQELLAIARAVGWGAGEILLATQQADLKVQDLADGPVTVADSDANDYILNNLHASLGTEEFGYLTEETYKLQLASDRLEKDFVWIIDPLDGTNEYIQKTGEFAVHIALVHDHRPVVAVVACPAAGRLYFAALGGGTFVEQKDGTIAPVLVSQRSEFDQLIVVASRSHRSDRFNQLMQQFPCQTQKSIGSLGGKIAAIVDQHADVYLSLSGSSAPKDWDLAAPELILTEAGGKFTHFDGTPLLYNCEDVTQWGGLLASNGTCHEILCTEAARILTEIDR